MARIPKPAPDEHAPYYAKYIALTADDALPQLQEQIAATLRLLAGVPEERALHRYAPGKWSVKEVVGHLADAERVFAYRAMRFARADHTELAGFDENHYVPAGNFDRRPVADLAAELAAVRAATVALFRSFDDQALLRRGVANGNAMSARAAAHVIAGHEAHHVNLLRERYGLR